MGRAVIIVPMHKEAPYPQSDLYMPIFVGRALSEDDDSQIAGDNTGDNISAKNRTFCELTAHYWMWKNSTSHDYIGMCHYRRYFSLGRCHSVISPQQIDNIRFGNIEQLLKGRDILLIEPVVFKQSLATHYRENHYAEDLDVTREIIARQCPEYIASYDRVMSGNKFAPYNMFITSAVRFCDYSEWLFSILFELEGSISIDDRDAFQQRVFGYVAERLLNVYVHHHGLRPRYLPITLVDGYNGDRKVTAGQSRFVRFKHNLIFALTKK